MSLFVCIVHCHSIITSEEYYRRTIFIPFIDSLIQQLNEKFSRKTISAMKGIEIEKLPESEIFEYYQSDLPGESSFSQEIHLWKQNWVNEKNIPTTLSETLKYMKNMKEIFPNITRVLSILLTTAANSAGVERANSAFRHVKTDFRSMMDEERLKGMLRPIFCIDKNTHSDGK